ncbi:MAG: hypothetical protein HQL68_05630, partial [Magnetococcales bacterium]|nr:hypothetical protein [Magnetococcales bacterium]
IDHLFGLGGNDIFVFELNDAGATDTDTIWDFNMNSETDKLKLTQNGEVVETTTLTSLISAQTTSGSSRSIVFADSNAGTQVTIVVYNIARDLTSSDFCATGASDPLVLDLNGNGVELTSYTASPVMFDVNADGTPEQTGWVGGGDGLLVLDSNKNGTIDDMSEVISEYFTTGAQTSLAALATLDLNHDGQIDSNDAAFEQLNVWVDKNSDGISTPQELQTLSQTGITSLGLTLDNSSAVIMNDNMINGYADVVHSDGHHGTMAEVQFSYAIPGSDSADLVADIEEIRLDDLISMDFSQDSLFAVFIGSYDDGLSWQGVGSEDNFTLLENESSILGSLSGGKSHIVQDMLSEIISWDEFNLILQSAHEEDSLEALLELEENSDYPIFVDSSQSNSEDDVSQIMLYNSDIYVNGVEIFPEYAIETVLPDVGIMT